jgi:RNA polymerase sigma-70 factor, ECF subfamily
MTDASERSLIQRAQQGDPDAVAALYRRHVDAITRYIGYRVSNEALIEDLTSEVFLRMVEGLSTYRITGAPFESWLYRIAAARIADHYRARKKVDLTELTDVLSSGEAPLELTLQQRQEVQELRTALGQLSTDQQTILILRFVERRSHDEVARIMGKNAAAIATAQHRALKRLAEILGTEKTDRHYLRGQ